MNWFRRKKLAPVNPEPQLSKPPEKTVEDIEAEHRWGRHMQTLHREQEVELRVILERLSQPSHLAAEAIYLIRLEHNRQEQFWKAMEQVLNELEKQAS
jgi:hypothetical protein